MIIWFILLVSDYNSNCESPSAIFIIHTSINNSLVIHTHTGIMCTKVLTGIIYLTDCLCGVHIVAEKQFLIQGSNPQALLWNDFSFNLYFEKGTIHSSLICPVAVNALVGGAFRFPQDTQLVSAIYAISFAEELLQPVTLEIQHCVVLKSAEQFKYLSFMIAHIDESAPPYEFHLVNGGKFKVNSLYGRIKRQKFCLVGIGKTSDGYSSHESSNGEDDPSSDSSQDDNNDETSTNSDIDSDIEGSNSGNG